MSRTWFVAAGLVLAGGVLLHAREDKAFVSATFRDILLRVSSRDGESGAILTVKAREDAPRPGIDLELVLQEVPNTDDVIVTLRQHLMSGGVHEEYLLRKDDALRDELRRRRSLAALEIERERRLTQKHSEEIPVLSGGRLKAGMTFAQVEALTGKPLAMPPIQAAGTVVWVFADKTLTFKNERLAEMRLEKSP
jgi:hypothetical protein